MCLYDKIIILRQRCENATGRRYLIAENDDGLDIGATIQDSNDLGDDHGELGLVESPEVKRTKGSKVDGGIDWP